MQTLYKKTSSDKLPRARFSLRTLLLIFTVAGLALGLVGSSLSKARREQAAIAELLKLGAGHDDWLGWRELLGTEYRPIVQIDLPSELSLFDAIEHLIHLDNLEHLSLGANTTDLELAHLEKLNWLESLHMSHTRITNAGLQHLRPMTNLRFLYLEGTAVTDDAVIELQKNLPSCKIIR